MTLREETGGVAAAPGSLIKVRQDLAESATIAIVYAGNFWFGMIVVLLQADQTTASVQTRLPNVCIHGFISCSISFAHAQTVSLALQALDSAPPVPEDSANGNLVSNLCLCLLLLLYASKSLKLYELHPSVCMFNCRTQQAD